MKKLLVTSLALSVSCFAGLGADNLQKAREDLAGLLQKYTELHPAVQIKRQQVSSALQAAELNRSQAELDALLERYTDLHPLVRANRHLVAGCYR